MLKHWIAAMTVPALMIFVHTGARAAAGAQPELVLQFGELYRLGCIALSGDGSRMATGGEGRIKLWNARTGELWRDLEVSVSETGGAFGARPLALSPDGRSVALAHPREKVELWDTRTGRLLRVLKAPGGWLYSVLWTQDRRTFAVSGERETWLWDTTTWQHPRRLPAGGGIALSTDGRRMVSASMRTGEAALKAELWDVAAGKRRRVFYDGSDVFGPVALSPDGQLMATAGEDPAWKRPAGALTEAGYSHDLKVKVWDVRTGKRRLLLPGHHNLGAGTGLLAFTPDNKHLVIGGGGFIQLRDAYTGKLRREIRGELGQAAALSMDGRVLAYQTLRERAALRSLRTGKRLWLTPPAPPYVEALAYSPDGFRLAAGELASLQGTSLRLWDSRTGRLAQALPYPPGSTRNLTFLPDGQSLVRNQLGLVQIWDLRSGRIRRSYPGPPDWMGIPQWNLLSPDGKTLVIAHSDSAPFPLEVRDAATGRLLRTIEGFDHWLASAVFSPDSRRIANEVGLRECGVAVWNLQTGQREHQFPVPTFVVQPLAFSPDGSLLAGFCPQPARSPVPDPREDKPRWEMRLWDLKPGQLRWVTRLGERVESLAFSPRGDLLAAGGEGRITLLDTQEGRQIRTLEGHDAGVPALAFDGSRLASGGSDGRIRIWEAATGRLLATLIGLPPAREGAVSNDWITLTPAGAYDASPGAARFLRWRVGDQLLPAAAYADR
jgi:WD40 repeat protein